ncbi:transcriptional repressor LexA [Candidatus Acetothermia bacterium]|nr:transcriptional repressor LexA [Candidatus Acetothermia bacterium]MBI3660975.1 transcriptional repressor LexA [Candidatus Acetothermia bacterium]
MEEITERQRKVLKFIAKAIEQRGFPPSVREIGRALGISSLRGVTGHLDGLERKGFIKRNSTARGIQLLKSPEGIPLLDMPSVRLPLVGAIAAGTPILAERNITDWVPVPKRLAQNENAFLLRVQGDSMIEDHILDGDLVIVKPQPTAQDGEIVAAIIEDEATVKRFYDEGDQIRLQPANSSYSPIMVSPRDFRIAGRVIGLLRSVR